MTTIDLDLLWTLARATAQLLDLHPRVGLVGMVARLSKERARSGITIPMHDGAWNFFERTAGLRQ